MECDFEKIPLGIELFENDLLALFEGQLQVWDLASVAMRSWFPGDPLNSPIAFLYGYLGEQVNPQINQNALSERWGSYLEKLEVHRNT
jgi:hypothetical protein